MWPQKLISPIVRHVIDQAVALLTIVAIVNLTVSKWYKY